jgi:outer membrane receptor for ferrienterochelin and colicins
MKHLSIKLYQFSVASVMLLAIPSSAYADYRSADEVHVHMHDAELDALLAMGIEKLTSVSVTVASKKEEKITEAPSIVSVVTRDDIKKYGAINMLDIFNRVPSLQVIGSTFLPTNVLSIRGATNQHYTNRVLFLIDGRPFRDAHTGGWNMPLFQEYPISNIEQIEVIRGPGSVLYGTNAFSGVINIITRKAGEANETEASVAYGSFGRRQLEARSAYSGEDWSVVSAVKQSRANGYRYTLTGERGVTDSYKHNETGHGLSLKANYKNLTVQAFRGRVDQVSTGAFASFPVGNLDMISTFVDVGYTHPLTGDWKVDMNVTFNGRRNGYSSNSFQTSNEDLVLLETSAQGSISDDVHLLFGGSFEHHDGMIVDSAYQNQWHNAYSQLDWQANDWLKLVGGVQLNDSADFQSHFSPRAAAIVTFDEHWGAKLLYGEAFRAGTAVESSVKLTGFLVGDAGVQPETIKTLEAQLSYNNKKTSVSLTAYRSKIQDIIGRISNPTASGLLITNTGDQSFKGLELEGKYIVGGGWSIQGSAALQTGENDEGLDNPTFYANEMAKLGAVYDAGSWSVAMFDSWFGEPEHVRNANGATADVNPHAESYHLVSLNANVSLNKAFEMRHSIVPIDFNLFVENVLDEDIYFPEFNRKNINSIPIDTGRAVFGRITVKF